MKKVEQPIVTVEEPQESISEILQKRVLPEVKSTFEKIVAERERLERLRATLADLEAKAEKLKEEIPALEQKVLDLLADGQDPEPTQRELKEAREAQAMTAERIEGLKKSAPVKEQALKESTMVLRDQIREALSPVRSEFQASLDRRIDEAMDLLDSWKAALEAFHQDLGLMVAGPGEGPGDAAKVVGLQIRSHPRLKVLF